MSDVVNNPESYAWKPMVIFSASLLMLSVSLNNVGFKEVVDAYAKSIVYKLENQECKTDIDFKQQTSNRLDKLEINSHQPSGE